MHAFTLSRVSDAREAIATHRRDVDAVFIAGGTDLIGLIKDRAALPAHVIDINGLPGMSDVDARPDGSLVAPPVHRRKMTPVARRANDQFGRGCMN